MVAGPQGKCPVSLPMAEFHHEQQVLVKPFSPAGRQSSNNYRAGPEVAAVAPPGPSDYDKSDINRLLKAIRNEEADRLPYLELDVASQSAYEYVLERELEKDATGFGLPDPRVRPDGQRRRTSRLASRRKPSRAKAPSISPGSCKAMSKIRETSSRMVERRSRTASAE